MYDVSAIISRTTAGQIAVEQLSIGVVRCQLLLLLLLPAPPPISLVHAEQRHEDDEEKHRDARDYQYPDRAGFLSLHLLLYDGRALVVQLVRPIAELHIVAVLGDRQVGAIKEFGLHLDRA